MILVRNLQQMYAYSNLLYAKCTDDDDDGDDSNDDYTWVQQILQVRCNITKFMFTHISSP